MVVLHLLYGGVVGGIELFLQRYSKVSKETNVFVSVFEKGPLPEGSDGNNCFYFSLADNRNRFSKKHEFIKIVKRFMPDAIIVHHGNVHLFSFYLWTVRRFPKIRHYRMVHSCFSKTESKNIKHKLGSLWCEFLMRLIIRKSDGIIHVSQASLDSYANSGFYCNKTLKKARVIRIGLEKRYIDEANKMVVDPVNRKRVLYIGRVNKKKGVFTLLSAFDSLSRDGYHLTVVGPIVDDFDQSLFLKKRPDVDYYHETAELEPFYKNNGIFVMPSTYIEGLPLSLIEAEAHGLICVANDLGGMKELICDGKNGFLTSSLDVSNLIATIKKAEKTYEIGNYQNISQNAKDFSRHFFIEDSVKAIESFISA